MSTEMLERLSARRSQAAAEREQLIAKRQAIVDLAEEEKRDDLSEEEDTEFRSLTGKLKDLDEGNADKGIVGIGDYDKRINELTEELRRTKEVEVGAAKLRRAMADVKVMSEERTYAKGNGRSYFQDLARITMNMDGNGESRARLNRHAEEVGSDKEYRDLTRTDGAGGFFVPPLWLMSQWIELARASRATANVVTNQDLPAGTDSINIPRVATGTATAIQTGDNQPVQETDLTDDSVAAPVRTIAGQQDVAIQLLDQSPVNFDEIIFRDLMADYATKVDLQVIGGSGASGQVTGIRSTASIETVTAGTATVTSLYAKLADAIQRVHTLRFMPPTVIVMHPRRWAYLLAAVDSAGRPLVGAEAGPQNALASVTGVTSEQVVGRLHGLPVVTDPNLPTTLGAGTNEDRILVLRASDLILWESSVRTRTLPEVGSGNLTVRLQVYGYIAFSAARYPKSVVELAGAGLVAPTFA